MANIHSWNQNFKPNDIDSDIFLSEVPLNLMKENIKSQFISPFEDRRKDYVTTFINMYKFSKINIDIMDEDEQLNIVELRDSFYIFMKNLFMTYLNVGFENFEDMSEDDQDEIIHYTYRFFISNIKKNFTSFIWNNIVNNKKKYSEIENKKKDVTSMCFKKEVTDDADIYILANLSNIIYDILHNDNVTVDDFFKYCDTGKCLETRFVQKKYDEFIITGNFIPSYINMFDNEFSFEIESYIRNKILFKYKLRNK